MRVHLTSALAGSLLFTLAHPALAQTTTADAPGTVVRAADTEMTCSQMADEAAMLSAGMGENGPGLLGRVSGVARAGASMLVPGVGLALAGADALASSGKDRKAAEVDAKRDRWNYLNGLYAGRGCNEAVSPSAAPPTSPPGATAPPAAPVAAPAPVPAITPGALPH